MLKNLSLLVKEAAIVPVEEKKGGKLAWQKSNELFLTGVESPVNWKMAAHLVLEIELNRIESILILDGVQQIYCDKPVCQILLANLPRIISDHDLLNKYLIKKLKTADGNGNI